MRYLLLICMSPFFIQGQGLPEGISIELLASNGFYNIKAVEGRTSSGPQISTGFIAGLGGEHFKMHIGYFYTQERF